MTQPSCDDYLKCDICNMYDYGIRYFKYYNMKICTSNVCIKQLQFLPFNKIETVYITNDNLKCDINVLNNLKNNLKNNDIINS